MAKFNEFGYYFTFAGMLFYYGDYSDDEENYDVLFRYPKAEESPGSEFPHPYTVLNS